MPVQARAATSVPIELEERATAAAGALDARVRLAILTIDSVPPPMKCPVRCSIRDHNKGLRGVIGSGAVDVVNLLALAEGASEAARSDETMYLHSEPGREPERTARRDPEVQVAPGPD
jgi:hypothetical protein